MTIESFNESVNADIRRMTAQQGEPTSFSAWLEANGDSIEPLDRTEATTQWFDEKDGNLE